MTALRTAAQQALEALELSTPKARNEDDYAEQGWEEHHAAITALRAALAEPQEPVAPELEYGGTNFGFTFAGITLTDGDKRLAALLTNALGNVDCLRAPNELYFGSVLTDGAGAWVAPNHLQELIASQSLRQAAPVILASATELRDVGASSFLRHRLCAPYGSKGVVFRAGRGRRLILSSTHFRILVLNWRTR